jgi:phenylpropionate dioxygenase-like ring-hydroxylating dioxygenase large terminal subunit
MIPHDSLFDPAHYHNVRKPLLEAETLPRWCYTSEAFHAGEVERIFLKMWCFVGRLDELPNPGDYMAVDLPGGPILIMRARDGVVRAFANTCRHRGAKLLDGRGNCRSGVVCPYHSWTYGLDGRLAGAPNMAKTLGFDKAHYGLEPIRLDHWAGFMFVNFAKDGPTLLEQLGDMPQQLGPYRLDDMVCVKRLDFEVKCNWKFLLENALESYHTATVHRETLGEQWAEDVETTGDWRAIFLPGEKSVSVLPGEMPPFPRIDGLNGRAAGGTYFTAVFPSTQFACAVDSMWWLRIYPKGPGVTLHNFGFCFPKSTVADPDFERKTEPYFRRWLAGALEDNLISEAQHAGAQSVAHRPGPFSHRERAVHEIANWLLDRVLDQTRPARREAVHPGAAPQRRQNTTRRSSRA